MKVGRLAVPLAGIALVLAGSLAFGNLNGNLVYYLAPEEAVERRAEFADERRFRLAGRVVEGSIEEAPGGATFVVTDGRERITVEHTGAPPQLFRAGIEVVVEGHWRATHFTSDVMLIKHDEQYQPPEHVQASP